MTSIYEIGQFIQKRRKNIGITQKELADRLHISPQAVSKWETGETLPDTSILIRLSQVLETTTDKILTGGTFVLSKNKKINIQNVIDGFNALENLRNFFGENSTFYKGAIEGINQKMNIDFEKYIKDDYSKEVLLAEVIIQYLMEGYTTTRDEIRDAIKSDKMRNIIYKYMDEESKMDKLYYNDNPKLFDKIRSIRNEFKGINELNSLPGEYLRLDSNKNYWATQIETDKDFCYGIAVDEKIIRVFVYGYGGADMKLVHEEQI